MKRRILKPVRVAMGWALCVLVAACGGGEEVSETVHDSGNERAPTGGFVDSLSNSNGCIPRVPQLDAGRWLGCRLFEALPAPCNCTTPGHGAADPAAVTVLRRYMSQRALCDQPGTPPCDDFCFCQLVELSGAALASCQNAPQATGDGWCVIAPGQDAGSAALLADCPPSTPARIRFLGSGAPASNALMLLLCS